MEVDRNRMDRENEKGSMVYSVTYTLTKTALGNILFSDCISKKMIRRGTDLKYFVIHPTDFTLVL